MAAGLRVRNVRVAGKPVGGADHDGVGYAGRPVTVHMI